MKLYTTKIKAICPKDGELKTYAGPNVPGITFNDARQYCERNGLGYCEVDGELIAEIPVKEGRPDWKEMIDYENKNLN